MRLLIPLFVALLLATATANAHVSLDVGEAAVGKSYKAVLKVGHGCAGEATTAIRVRLPSELSAARPQPKAGWTLALKNGDAHAAGGHHHAAPVQEISWSGGPLPDGWYDEFVFVAAIPADAKPGPVYLPVVQQCGDAAARWIELPGASGEEPGEPAPVLTLVPASKP